MQEWTPDDGMVEPTWPGNVGTSFVDFPYHQRFRRMAWFESPGTLNTFGAAFAGNTFAFLSAADNLGYLKQRPAESQFNLEWSGRRDGAGGPSSAMMWLDHRGDLYAQDGLDLSWTFMMESQGGEGTPQNGGGFRIVTPTVTSPFVPGAAFNRITSGSTGATGIGAQVGTGIAKPSRFNGKKIGPDTPEIGPNATGWKGWFVAWRLQGSFVRTNSSLGNDYDGLYHLNVDGYCLVIQPVQGGSPSYAEDADLRLRLYSTTATSTSATNRWAIAEQRIPNGVANLNLKGPVKVRIECENNGSGDVEIKVFLGPYGGAQEQQMFLASQAGSIVEGGSGATVASDGTITDATADKITGQGTIGFGGFVDRVEQFGEDGPNEITVAEGLVNMEHKVLGIGTTLVRDEFRRVGVSLVEGTQSAVYGITNRFGHTGQSLEADWWWGLNANATQFSGVLEACLDPNEINATLYDPTPYWTIDVEPGAPPAVASTSNRREVVSLRPADDKVSQHRQITFRPGAQNAANPNYPSSASFGFGIILFGEAIAGFVNTGIAVELLLSTDAAGAQDSVTVRVGLWGASSPGDTQGLLFFNYAQQVLASPPNLLDGSDHTLAFDCHAFVANAGTDTPLVYKVVIDGTAVVWTADDIPAAETVQLVSGGEEIIHFNPDVFEGEIEAVFWRGLTPETDTGGVKLYDPWRIHSWTQLTLTTGGGIGPDEMASVVLNTEATLSGQSLDDVMCAEFSVTEATSFLSSLHTFDSGHTGAVNNWDRRRRSYGVGVSAMPQSELDALLQFWEDHNGIQQAFTWTQDGEDTLNVCFVDDTLTYTLIGPGVYAVEFQLREVFV